MINSASYVFSPVVLSPDDYVWSEVLDGAGEGQRAAQLRPEHRRLRQHHRLRVHDYAARGRWLRRGHEAVGLAWNETRDGIIIANFQ